MTTEATTSSRTPLAAAAGAPARRRLAGSRGDLGQDHAPLDGQGDRAAAGPGRRPPGRRRAAGRLRLRGRERHSRATSCSPSTATRSRSTARARSGSSRPTRRPRTSSRRAKVPPAAGQRTAVTAGRPAAALLITGQELLLGLVADANTRFLAHELDALGIELRRVSIVGDEHDEIAAGLRELAGHDLVITSGGLGPTHDDRTVEAVAEVAGAELVLDEELLDDDRRHHRGVRAAARHRPRAEPRRRPQAGARAARRDRDPAGRHRARAAAGARRRSRPRAAGPAARAGDGLGTGARARADRGPARARGHAAAAHAARLRRRGAGRGAGVRGRRAATPAGTRTTICARAHGGGGHDPRRARAGGRRSTRSSPACASSWARRSTPRTSARWPSTCSRCCARAACAWRWPSRAPRASSPPGWPTSPAPRTSCSAA